MKGQNFESLAYDQQYMQEQQQPNVGIESKPQDYFSLLCRNGPLPQKYHKRTDVFCLVAYLGIVICMIILLFANGISSQNFTYEKEDELKNDLFFGTRFFLWETLFSAFCVMVLSLIFTLIALYIPGVMSFVSILILFALCIFFIFIQIKRYFINQQKIILYLLKAALSLIIIVLLVVILARRKNRIANLGIFLELPSKMIRSNICLLYSHMVFISLAEIAIWYGFVNLYYGVATVTKINSQFIHFIAKLTVVIVWLWTTGALIAFSDYFATSYTVHWFYNLSKQDQFTQNLNFNPQPQVVEDQIEQEVIEIENINKYESGVLKPIYNKLQKHLGTILFGGSLAFLPLYLISKAQKMLFKTSSKQVAIATLSKYGYLDTIMEQQNFLAANYRVYKLRRRVKSVMPQLYMLGHMYGDFTKLALVSLGLAGVNEFVQVKSDIAHHGAYSLYYLFMLLLFGTGLCLQIATNFTNFIGKCGDVAFFLYCIDLEVQRVYYSRNQNYSTPKSILQILRPLTIKRNWKHIK